MTEHVYNTSSNIDRYLNKYAENLGIEKWLDHQVQAMNGWEHQGGDKALLYFKTGAGKTATALAMMRLRAESHVVVIAPPSTHKSWQKQAHQLGLEIETISHAKFRMPDYKMSRSNAVIVDEFHLLGGHTGKGWKKMDRLAASMGRALILCSATPNYNDAERVYCLQHVLDPEAVRGGYLEFLYTHCNTKQNPFSQTPDVDDRVPFKNHKDAAEFLSKLPNVYYLEDDATYDIEDIDVVTPLPLALEMYGYEGRAHRMIASRIEEEHTRTYLGLVANDNTLHPHVMDILDMLVRGASTPVLIFAAHSKIAAVLSRQWDNHLAPVFHGLVTGDTSGKEKDRIIGEFLEGNYDALIGTASLATGTDGMDKMCDTLIILDDTNDAALRRQLVGRILPRGINPSTNKKRIFRINLTTISE